ncbi:MAG: hypothetical protein ACFCUU_00045 [Cyclobacteriaceae bacterium]
MFAKNQTTEDFENAINEALLSNSDFCYETNFDLNPLHWAQKFRNKGYQINLIFFCLENQEVARHRIRVRTEFKGHFVDDKTLELKWKAGYKNVNLYFQFFDNILFVDNSKQSEVYTNLLQIEQGKIVLMAEKLPDYFKHRLPDVFKLFKTK